jgi:tetratricopeptide (TPR) repeat protein
MVNDLRSGLVLGHYRLVEQIGAGGMGVVYRARDDRLERDVAIKVIHPGIFVDDLTHKRFKREAVALAKLNHPNIATVHDFDSEGDREFLVMELLGGQSLAEVLMDGPLPEAELVQYAMQLAEGLAAAHEQGIIHRDLKPGNLRVLPEGRLKILDFGLSKLLFAEGDAATASLPASMHMSGTLPYMAPEQLRSNEADARTDIYAAGVVLYEMATGMRPYRERGMLVVDSILNSHAPLPTTLNPHVSLALEAVILRAMEREPEQRYQSARELQADIECLLTSRRPIAARETSLRRTRKALFLVALVFTVGLIAAGVWRAWPKLRPGGTATGQRQVLLVGEFENRTGDPVFDATLREMFSATLQQSASVSVYPPSRTADVLETMGRSPAQPIDERIGLEVCQRAGLQGLLLGSISRIGTGYTLVVRALHPSGDTILNETKSAATANEIPAVVDSIAEALRTTLGESNASVKDSAVPLARVTSPSLEAIRYYTSGKQQLYSGHLEDAALLFTKALELDPNFAMAHAYLGITYEHLEQPERRLKHLREASLLAGRVSEPERLKILGDYYNSIMDYEKGCGYDKLLADLQPDDPTPLVNLGVCQVDTFNPAAALASTEKAIQMLPKSRIRINLASQLYLAGQSEKALPLAQALSKEYTDDVFAQKVLGSVYLALGRVDEARNTFGDMVKVEGNSETTGHLRLADTALATGRYKEAKTELDSAILAADKSGNRFAAVIARTTLADPLLALQTPAEARKTLSELTLPDGSAASELVAGIAFASNRQWEAAQRSLHRIDGLVAQADVPALRSMRYLLQAEIELNQKEFQSAIASATKAVGYFRSPFAIESLARCHEAAGAKDEAAKQYEQLLQRANERSESFDAPAFHRVVNAHYRLGVLYKELGRDDDARLHLQKFLAYWAHPDPSLPAYTDAQRRLRTLSGSATPAPAT